MKLAAWMALENLTHEQAAARIGCDRSTLTRILPGSDGKQPARRPGWKLLRKISVGTNGAVTANDFMDDPESFAQGNVSGSVDPSEMQPNSALGVAPAQQKERAA